MRGPALRDRYSRAGDFQALRRRFDPSGKFGTDLLDELLPAPGGGAPDR
jgi:hypothetical protein